MMTARIDPVAAGHARAAAARRLGIDEIGLLVDFLAANPDRVGRGQLERARHALERLRAAEGEDHDDRAAAA